MKTLANIADNLNPDGLVLVISLASLAMTIGSIIFN